MSKPTEKQISQAVECNINCTECYYYDSTTCCTDAARDAAELIFTQAARIRELEASVPRWIPVSDKGNRPNDGQTVFTYCIDEGQIYILDYAADENDGEGAFGSWKNYFDSVSLGFLDSEFIAANEVSHWMPMPKQPKDGEVNC